jgi:hypothetical protein
MTRLFGFVSVLAAVAIGFYLYSRQVQSISPGPGSLTSAVEVMAVRNDLLGMANAERRYWALNARYASLDELRANGDAIPTRPNYAYTVDASETAFKVIATYSGSDPEAPRRLSIDSSMSVEAE